MRRLRRLRRLAGLAREMAGEVAGRAACRCGLHRQHRVERSYGIWRQCERAGCDWSGYDIGPL